MYRKLYIWLGIVFICMVDISYALPPKMQISMGRSPGTVEIKYKTFRELLNFGEEKNIGNVAKVCWNADGFILRNGTSDIGEFELSSKEIPVILDSFSAPKCEVWAPGVNIFGTSHINDFCADIRRATGGLLKITGTLAVKLLDVSGPIQIDGTVNIAEDGCMVLRKLRNNDFVTINGQLISAGILRLDGSKAHARVINNGEIISLSEEALFLVSSFTNGEQGKIRSATTSFELENRLENLGELQFENFTVSLPSEFGRAADLGLHNVNFYQRGVFYVSQSAMMDCNIESFGRTTINQLTFPHSADFKILAGQTYINRVDGAVSILQAKDGATAKIDNLRGRAEFVKSLSGRLQIGTITSTKKSVFASKFGGNISVDRVETPGSFIFSHDSQVDMGGISGTSTAYATGNSRLKVSGATQLNILSTEHSKSDVANSTVDKAYLLGDRSTKFLSTTADLVTNHGTFVGVDTTITDFRNTGAAIFSGKTTTGSLSNHGYVTFQSGEHKIAKYSGESDQSRLQVEGEIEDDESQTEGPVVLRDGDAKVCVEKLTGTGIIEAPEQTYKAKIPTNFHIIGNVASFINYMPTVSEIPTHEGVEVRFYVDLQDDFINANRMDYGDAIFLMNLHGHKWENRGVLFGAGGLQVRDAAVFGNTDGIISLDKFLDVQAGKIFNISQPIARDNGRWVDDGSNWRARLIYHCPATYYSANPNTGIGVGGDITLHSESDITNRFSNITSMNGTFNATAGNSFENTVGNISAFGEGPSSISARTISNACLPAYLRQGSAHKSGRCGWGWTRRTWHAYSHTAELVTQSHGSAMLFSGDTTFVGHTDNIGSKISSGGLFSGDVNFTSILENIATQSSSGTLISGGNLHYQRPRIFVHADFDFEGE